ncbi:MAG: 4Fe-4S binding protein [Deltaproteobacteria bacterium]|nr:4Fe-4S binding protein [Deltaproteobacteria bacterium]
MKRKIIEINEDLCNGCGNCIPNCPEGALRIIDGKARLISDLFCDGLGACVKECPLGALRIIEREAEPYDEKRVMENIVKQGKNVIIAHLMHLKEHGEFRLLNEAIEYLKEKGINIPTETEKDSAHHTGCPSANTMTIKRKEMGKGEPNDKPSESYLANWPVQMKLISPYAPYLKNADLLLAADCVPFAYADFHRDFLRGRVLIILCPKLDESIDDYIDKLTEIIKVNEPKSINVLHMEVPCCFGTVHIAKEAVRRSGKDIVVKNITITIGGDIKD